MTPALFSLSSPPPSSPPPPSSGKDFFPGLHSGLRVRSANSDCGCRAAKEKLPPSFYPFPFKPFFSRAGSPAFFPSPAQQQNPSGAFPFSSGRGCRIFSPPPSLPGLTFSHGRDMVSNAEMHGKEENWNRHNCGKSQAPLRGKRRPRFRWCGGYAPFLPPCSQELEQSHLRRNE